MERNKTLSQGETLSYQQPVKNILKVRLTFLNKVEIESSLFKSDAF